MTAQDSRSEQCRSPIPDPANTQTPGRHFAQCDRSRDPVQTPGKSEQHNQKLGRRSGIGAFVRDGMTLGGIRRSAGASVHAIAMARRLRGNPVMQIRQIAMAVKASATNRPACCTAVPAVLASPRFQGSRGLLRRPWRSEFPLEFQWFAPPSRDGGWPVNNVKQRAFLWQAKTRSSLEWLAATPPHFSSSRSTTRRSTPSKGSRSV